MRESFVFYRSFYDAIKDLPDEQQVKSFKAIAEYALNGEEATGTGIEKTVFSLTKPQIDANNKRYESGARGGRPKSKDKPNDNQTVTKDKPNDNQTVSKGEPNVNDNVNENDNNKNNVQAQDLFERLWEMYPLKRGKGQVSDANKRQLLDIGYEQLAKAVERYKADLAKENWRKPQNGSTFFNSGYKDYLDCNYSPAPARKGVGKSVAQNFEQRSYGATELERQLLKN
jgi:hypothetical protein